MKLAIITRSAPPAHCGIGDYTMQFTQALHALGKDVRVFAGRGANSAAVSVIPDRWDASALSELLQRLIAAKITHVLLQFTPLMFGREPSRDGALATFWSECRRRWATTLLVHETYFHAWRHPPSWFRGPAEKRLLRRMVEQSRFVFTASVPLVDEISKWRTGAVVSHMPIGSNFQRVNVDRSAAREACSNQIRLVLFGGGNSLQWMRHHVQRTDAILHAANIDATWVLLGGIPRTWFKLRLPAECPDRLDEADVSIQLTAADIFLMPHYAGLSSKRGTLMAAMQHALPVVGTETAMTDSFWHDLEGIVLVKRNDDAGFAQHVLSLCHAGERREAMGRANQRHFDSHYSWPCIVQTFLHRVDP